MSLAEKYRQLRNIVNGFSSVAVAFSGGVDSTLLLKVASDCLGSDKVLALTAVSPIFPAYEIEQSRQLAQAMGVQQEFINSHELELDEFINNDPQRCYHCKLNLFSLFLGRLKNSPHDVLFDGSNRDDLDDYRPGQKAIKELQIRSPLLEADFCKQEIRQLSKQLALPTWNKQPVACLASRFPYGTLITRERLSQVDCCEAWLRVQGFSHYRVRWHAQLARIEVAPGEFERLLDAKLRNALIATCKMNGFDYVTLDLQGYRSGSMNETLPESARE